MNFILNRPAIKAEARRFISENTRWGKMILATFVILLLSGGISFSVNIIKGFNNIFSDYYGYYPGTRGYSLSTNIITILIIPFTIAAAGYYLNHIRGFSPTWQSLYKEGFDHYGKYLLTGFLTNLFTALWTCLLIIPGIVMGFAYSQAKYIIHDNPNLDSTEAIKISKMITKGYKGDLFILYLSFIGWYILTGLTAGILCIYVIPYVETTAAMYYENLKRNAIDTGLVAPEAFGIMPHTAYQNNRPSDNPHYNPPYNNGGFNSRQTQGYSAEGFGKSSDANPNSYNNTEISPEDTFKPGEPDENDIN